MCTLLVAFRCWPETPLLVAANRDERLARPASSPEWRDNLFAPLDLQAGGTWIGIRHDGLFAAVTNRFGLPPDATRRSRGELVPRALDALDALGAKSDAERVNPRDYNGFHLVVADRREAFLLIGDGETLRVESLAPGVHVVTERSFDAAQSGRVTWLEPRAEALARGPVPDDATLRALLSAHAVPSYEGTCVHLPEAGYGTRSSTILRVGGSGWSWRHADGPPCVTDYRDVY